MLGLFKKQHKRRDPNLRPWEEGGSRIKVSWGGAGPWLPQPVRGRGGLRAGALRGAQAGPAALARCPASCHSAAPTMQLPPSPLPNRRLPPSRSPPPAPQVVAVSSQEDMLAKQAAARAQAIATHTFAGADRANKVRQQGAARWQGAAADAGLCCRGWGAPAPSLQAAVWRGGGARLVQHECGSKAPALPAPAPQVRTVMAIGPAPAEQLDEVLAALPELA